MVTAGWALTARHTSAGTTTGDVREMERQGFEIVDEHDEHGLFFRI